MKACLRLVIKDKEGRELQLLPGTAPAFYHRLSFSKASWLQTDAGTVVVQEMNSRDFAIGQWNFHLRENLDCLIDVTEGTLVLLQPVHAHYDTLTIGEQEVVLLPRMHLFFYVPAGLHRFCVKGPGCFLLFTHPPLSFLEGMQQEVQGVRQLLEHFLQQAARAYVLPALPLTEDHWMRLKKIDVPSLQHGIVDLQLRRYVIDVLHAYGKAAKQTAPEELVFYSNKQKAVLLKQYLTAHYLDPELPGLEGLAQRFYAEARPLNTAFVQLTGSTIWHYVLSCRLQHAKELVTKSTLPIGEIGFRCCFADSQHFVRSFRKRFGITPGRLRKQVNEEKGH